MTKSTEIFPFGPASIRHGWIGRQVRADTESSARVNNGPKHCSDSYSHAKSGVDLSRR